MIVKDQIIEEVRLAEVAPGMRQDLCLLICTSVTMIYMLSQVLHVIEPLLLDKDKAALQAHLTKSLLVLLLQVKFETFQV